MVRLLFALLLMTEGRPEAGAPPTTIAPGVHLIRGAFVPGTQPDGNSVIFATEDGLVVVDTGRHAKHTQAIIDFAKSEKKPVRAIVNTHWHLDHIGGNVLLRREYPEVRIYASDALAGAQEGFLARYRAQLAEMLKKEDNEAFRKEIALIDAGPVLAPSDVVTKSETKNLAGRRLRIELAEHAATAGDLWLFDPATKVLVAGDLVTLPAPFLDTACPQGWSAALDRLAKEDFALLVPGHGPPMTRKQFDAYRAAFTALLGCKAAKDECVQGWIDALQPEGDPKFTQSLMEYYVDVLRSGHLQCGGASQRPQ